MRKTIFILGLSAMLPLLATTAMGQVQLPERPGASRDALQPSAPAATLRTESKFVKRHLMPKLSRQMERVMPVHTLEHDALSFRQSTMFDWMERSAASRAESGTRKALRNYILEDTGVARVVESIRIGRRGVESATGRSARSAVDFGVRFSHGQPQAEMRYRAGGGTLRVGVGGDGSSSLEFRPSYREARVHAAFDAQSGRYRLECRYRF